MMRLPTEEEIKLCTELRKTNDQKRIEQINERIREIGVEIQKELEKYPFPH